MKLAPIEKLDRPPTKSEFYREYFSKDRPVRIRGAFDAWPARRNWNFEYFRKRFGDTLVAVEEWDSRPDENGGAEYLKKVKVIEMRFDRLLDHLQAEPFSKKYYMAAHPFKRTFPGLSGDLGLLPYMSGAIREFPGSALSTNLWIGPGGRVTPLHYDDMPGMLMQFHGTKRIVIFPVNQLADVYIPHPEMERPTWSPVNFEAPDLNRFPRFGETTAFDCLLEPGDLVFIPRRAAHYVRSMDLSISMNKFWVPVPMALGMLPEFLSSVGARTLRQLRSGAIFRPRSSNERLDVVNPFEN